MASIILPTVYDSDTPIVKGISVWAGVGGYRHSITLGGHGIPTYHRHDAFSFRSSVKENDFMDDLVVVLSRVLQNFKGVIDCTQIAVHLGEPVPDWKSAEPILRKLRGSSEEKVLQFLILRQANVGISYAMALAKEYVERYKDCAFEDFQDVLCYLDPLRGRWGMDYLEALKPLTTVGKLKNAESVDYRNFLKDLLPVTFLMDVYLRGVSTPMPTFTLAEIFGQAGTSYYLDQVNKGILPKTLPDYITSEGYLRCFVSLPLHLPHYREYLLQKPLTEINLLFNKIPARTADTDVIQFSENILRQRLQINHTTHYLAAVNGFFRLMNKCASLNNDVNFWHDVNVTIINHWKAQNILELVFGYFDVTPPASLGEKVILDSFEIAWGEKVNKWLVSPTQNDFIAELLLEKTSSDKAFSILQEVAGERPLTVPEWKLFLANFEEYQKFPAAWWIPLLDKTVR